VRQKRRIKKLSRRRDSRRFVSLNISLSHSRSLKVIGSGTARKIGYGFIFAFRSNYGSNLHHFGDKARYWSKIAVSLYHPCIRRPRYGGLRQDIAIKTRIIVKNHDMFIGVHRIPACDRRTDRQTNSIQASKQAVSLIKT